MRSHVDLLKLLLMQFVIASLCPGHVHTNDGKRVFINEDSQRNYVNKSSKYQHTVQQQHVHHQYNLNPEMQQPPNQDQHRQHQHGQQQQRPTSSSTQSTNGYRSGVIDPMRLFRNPSVAVNAPGFLTFIPANMDVANPSGHSNIRNNYQGFSGTSYDNVKSGQTNFEADNNMAGTNVDSVPSFAGNIVGRPCTSNWQSCRQQCVRTDPNSGCPICTCEQKYVVKVRIVEITVDDVITLQIFKTVAGPGNRFCAVFERQTIDYNTQPSTSAEPAYRRPINERFNNPSGVANYRTGQISNYPDHPKEDDKENWTCPDYLHDCLPDCINFDSRGCLVCRCDFITCRPFLRDCPREFSTIDHSGCPVCLMH